MLRSSPSWNLLGAAVLALGLATPPSRAGVIVTEDFSSDPGWYSRDGEMTVAWNSGVGNPSGSMQGTFGDQVAPAPEIDAFRIDFSVLGGPWVGDYGTLYPGYTQFTFDFMAEDLLPRPLCCRSAMAPPLSSATCCPRCQASGDSFP
jgi:hypothetical protein